MLSITLRLSLAGLALCVAFGWACAQTTNHPQPKSRYDRLYAQAYRAGSAQPDSAIYYARQAASATQKPQEQANAHNLLAFYGLNQGYYGLAIQHYQQAYDLYKQPIQKATMLKNMAFCHKNTGNYQATIPIVRQAIQIFTKLKEVDYHIEALNLLANCHNAETNFGNAQCIYMQAVELAKRHSKPQKLASIYTDFANFKENQHKYDSAVYYQRLALQAPQLHPSKESIRWVKLAWYYLQSKNLPAAEQSLRQAQSLEHTSPKAWAYYWGVQGLVHYIKLQKSQAKQAYHRFDSLLQVLGGNTAQPIQQKFAHKTAYDMYHSGYSLIGRIWPREHEKAYFAQVRQWYAQRKRTEHRLLQKTKVNVTLRDSLVIARTAPRVNVVRQITPWWWLVMVAAIAIAGLWLYQARTQKLRAETRQVQAQANFVETIKTSPIKGMGDLSKAEVDMLAKIEHHQKDKLTADEVRMFVMVGRGGYTYKAISLRTNFTEGNIKTKVRRAKKACGVSNLKDLM
ncbi:tetratricopeptide repeat protein [Microscilla marina]|uniref:Tetratricopeptide repeat domain protein n=1 Tax=Microscilla marina ATCC 23134 TaxID=313606 RepID=A1ZJ97_MICM2|nr:sigma-70 region 4 domain-containing protein [Microscilla marina]EAY29633.1 tetratricopeptide repeat domain protein [Microscilla marina ATCC 23134]